MSAEDARVGSCRSCGAAIVWAVTGDGKRVPLNVDAMERRLAQVDELEDGTPVVRSVRTWVTHFATCPHADTWRRK